MKILSKNLTLLIFPCILILLVASCHRNNSSSTTLYKVKSIIDSYQGNVFDTILRTYDLQGRVSTIYYSSTTQSYRYNGDSVFIHVSNGSASGVDYFYILNSNGLAVFGCRGNEYVIYNYDNNGYLVSSYDTLTKEKNSYTISNGNIMIWVDSTTTSTTTYIYTYTNTPNNIECGQPYFGQPHGARDDIGGLGAPLSLASTYLPASVTSQSNLIGTATHQFSYSFDNAGRLIKWIDVTGTDTSSFAYQYY